MSKQWNDDTIVDFGKYKGKALADVPDAYLIWLYDNNKVYDIGLKIYIRDNYMAMSRNVDRIKNLKNPK